MFNPFQNNSFFLFPYLRDEPNFLFLSVIYPCALNSLCFLPGGCYNIQNERFSSLIVSFLSRFSIFNFSLLSFACRHNLLPCAENNTSKNTTKQKQYQPPLNLHLTLMQLSLFSHPFIVTWVWTKLHFLNAQSLIVLLSWCLLCRQPLSLPFRLFTERQSDFLITRPSADFFSPHSLRLFYGIWCCWFPSF